MNTITGNIKDYKPIQYNKQTGKYIIAWGLEDIGGELYKWNYYVFDKKPSLDTIKKVINKYINKSIKNIIENKFKWNNMNVVLTIEKQIDYKLLFDTTILLDGTNLPETVKFKLNNKSIYYDFETIDDMKDFIVALNNHIRSCIKKGNEMKDAIKYEDYIL